MVSSMASNITTPYRDGAREISTEDALRVLNSKRGIDIIYSGKFYHIDTHGNPGKLELPGNICIKILAASTMVTIDDVLRQLIKESDFIEIACILDMIARESGNTLVVSDPHGGQIYPGIKAAGCRGS